MSEVSILGCRVDVVDRARAVERIVELARGSEASLVVTLGTEMVVRARHDARFREIANASALSLCDTIGVLFAARYLHGVPMKERVAGVDLIDPLCARLAAEGLSLFLCGGKGDTAARAARVLQERHPALIVAGARDGYFSPADDVRVANEIAASGARVLLLGLGSPRQESWIADHLAQAACGVGIGVGGSFDVLAGNVERAPVMWQKLNVEWLYRLLREPTRWRRQLALPKFVWYALLERFLPNTARRFS
jgi:N-acetylglucosaminyldiphosphoundecaprenol N-acetyl-beta-D-mannosaminyltransferase